MPNYLGACGRGRGGGINCRMKELSSYSRRRFLQQATVVAGAAPLLLSGWSALGAPNERINLGFIGLGTQGRGLMGGFLGQPGTQVVAVCDVDTTRREDAKKRVENYYKNKGATDTSKGCQAYGDFRELLARPDVDGVVIATPDHWHAPLTIATAKAGKDVYCEKPLSKSVHESRAMVQAVRKHQRVLQVGSMQRSMREFRVACELVRNGLLGKIDHVDVGVGGPPVPCDLPEEAAEPGLNWDFWLGPAAVRSYNSVLSPRGVHTHFPNWRHYREFGGGGVCDFGAHHFDIAHWGLGMDEAGPLEVLPPADWKTAQSGVRLRYANDVIVNHTGGNGIAFFGAAGRVKVDRGSIEVTIGGKTIEKGDAPLRDQLERVEKEFLTARTASLYQSANHLADWLGAMRSRKTPICDVETGARTANVCHLVNLAYQYGEAMKWDAAREQFTGRTGKAEWLDIAHREPWKTA